MYSEKELKAFKVIDDFLLQLEKSDDGGWYNTYGKSSEWLLAKEIIDKHKLITYRVPGSKTSISDIGETGLLVIKAGGIQKYLSSINRTKEEKENLEIQQLRSNNILLTNQLVDYEKTKSNLKQMTIATIAVSVIALLELILLLLKSNLF